jgi:hypothetical protein
MTKSSVPEPIAGEMTAAKVPKMRSADEMTSPEMTGDMRTTSAEVASAAKTRTTTAKVVSAAKARTTTAKVRTAAKARTTTAKVVSAAKARTATAKVRTATAEMTAAMGRGDRHWRTAKGKRRNNCQHCPAHDFLTVLVQLTARQPERLH